MSPLIQSKGKKQAQKLIEFIDKLYVPMYIAVYNDVVLKKTGKEGERAWSRI